MQRSALLPQLPRAVLCCAVRALLHKTRFCATAACFCLLYWSSFKPQSLSLGTRKRPRQAGGFNKAYDRTGKQVHSDFAAGGASRPTCLLSVLAS